MDALTRLTSWIFPPHSKPPNSHSPNSPPNPRTQIRYSPKPHKIREPKSQIDKEYNMVLVPSDGECMTESDSDESDWSIGWLEPHGTEFEKEKDSSFAVLVPCYKTGTVRREGAVGGGDGTGTGTEGFERNVNGRNYIEQWLSSLQTPNVNSELELGSTSY